MTTVARIARMADDAGKVVRPTAQECQYLGEANWSIVLTSVWVHPVQAEEQDRRLLLQEALSTNVVRPVEAARFRTPHALGGILGEVIVEQCQQVPCMSTCAANVKIQVRGPFEPVRYLIALATM